LAQAPDGELLTTPRSPRRPRRACRASEDTHGARDVCPEPGGLRCDSCRGGCSSAGPARGSGPGQLQRRLEPEQQRRGEHRSRPGPESEHGRSVPGQMRELQGHLQGLDLDRGQVLREVLRGVNAL